MHDLNEGMKLSVLCKVLDSLEPTDMIRIYFDQITQKFYILHDSEFTLLIPQGCILLFSGFLSEFYTVISRILS